MKASNFLFVIFIAAQALLFARSGTKECKLLKPAENNRYLQTLDGTPFFWLGDTGWYLFQKLTREETIRYLDDRKSKGFNVIQCMVIPSLPVVDVYGDTAFTAGDISRPVYSRDPNNGDYWKHIEFVIDEAEKRDIYIGLVTIWGTVAKAKEITVEKAQAYITWLVNRYKEKENIIWINGGDIKGNIRPEIWNTIGNTIKANDTAHLVTFHPFGRTKSSTWFHNADWLDFNMFQSGHRRYDQKKGDGDPDNLYGEDNWRYVYDDYKLIPVKPTIDGEPSYEGIPQGLHDTTQPYWNANDCRRYAYWSVLAGAFGHTYGHNAIMQFFKKGNNTGNNAGFYGVRKTWEEALNDPGAGQMQYLKKLILSYPFFEMAPDSALITDQGKRYDYIAAAKGKNFALFYTYTGRKFTADLSKINGSLMRCFWYNPSNGEIREIQGFIKAGTNEFTPPATNRDVNDWVLAVENSAVNFPSSLFGQGK